MAWRMERVVWGGWERRGDVEKRRGGESKAKGKMRNAEAGPACWEEKTTVTGGGNQGRLYRQPHKREENGGVKGGLQRTAGRNKAAS